MKKFNFGLALIFLCIILIFCWLTFLKSVPFGMYFLMRPFVFSMPPFCHGAWGSAKYTFMPSFLVMYSWQKNSDPLSVVMVFIHFRYGSNRCTIVLAASFASLPWGSFSHDQPVCASVYYSHNCSFIVFAYYGVHFQVAESSAIWLFRAFMDTCAVGYLYAASPTGLRLCFKWCRQFL